MPLNTQAYRRLAGDLPFADAKAQAGEAQASRQAGTVLVVEEPDQRFAIFARDKVSPATARGFEGQVLFDARVSRTDGAVLQQYRRAFGTVGPLSPAYNAELRTGLGAMSVQQLQQAINQTLASNTEAADLIRVDGQFGAESLRGLRDAMPGLDLPDSQKGGLQALIRRFDAAAPGATPSPAPTAPIRPTAPTQPAVTGDGPLLSGKVDAGKVIVAVVDTPDDPNPHGPLGLPVDQTRVLQAWSSPAGEGHEYDFKDFLKDLRQKQLDDPEHRPVVLDLNVHGNNGTGLKLSTYRYSDPSAPPDQRQIVQDVSIASVAQINAWIKAAGFDPAEITVVLEACNAGPAYQVSADGLNTTERSAASTQATKLATKEATPAAKTEFFDPAAPKTDRTYLWIGRQNGGNPAGSVFLQYATGMGTGVTGEVAAAPLVDLTTLKTPVAVSGARNPWPTAHFNEMMSVLQQRAPRLFATPAAGEQ